jgi:hypothetical protein
MHLAKPKVNPAADERGVLQHTDFLYSCLRVLDVPPGEGEYKFLADQTANRDSYTSNFPFCRQCALHLAVQGDEGIDLKTPETFEMIWASR